RALLVPDQPEQTVDELALSGEDFAPRLGGREPVGPVDLGERLPPPAPRRPFELEPVGLQGRGIDIALERPPRHDLAAGLNQLAQRQKIARRRCSGFLGQLARCHRGRILALGIFALRDRPGSQVLLRPERSARVDEEELEAGAAPPIHQDAGAALGHPLSQTVAAGGRPRPPPGGRGGGPRPPPPPPPRRPAPAATRRTTPAAR